MKFEPIEDFLARVRKLNKANKDMRLSYEEANLLAISIAEMLAHLSKKPDPIVTAPTIIDGGSFPKRN